jgi:hypothetical protein
MIWRGDFEEKARETKVASPGADKPGVMMRVFGQVSGCLKEGAKRSWRDRPVQVRPG